MSFANRSDQTEILDREDIPLKDIERNMYELDVINTWLGGHRITIKGFKKLLGKSKKIIVCEIGCGGGDNIRALNKWCMKNKVEASFIGIDIKEECISICKRKLGESNKFTWIVSDYAKVPFDVKPHIIFSSLFCHHFYGDDLVFQLKWMRQNSTVGFFINDLQRHPVAYYSIKWLTRIFSSSYLVKNDAPLSVARGFTKKGWLELAAASALSKIEVTWQWAFRYLVVFKHAKQL